MQWNQENIPIKITNTKNTKKVIMTMKKEIIDIHQTITIINIINLCNNNTSQVRTITTTVMIVTMKIKESLITIVIVMRILKYSTYPTKDKKYVCQRGQFEGFHVESVEFCKLKIAHGPQVFPGAAGAAGAAGPPRITQLNVTNTYQIGESFLNNFTTSDNLI